MEEGCPSLADQLATCEQRIRDLEQTTANQQAVIAQQQDTIAHQVTVIARQLEVAAEPSGPSFAPASQIARKWKRQRYTWSKRRGSLTAVRTATTARRCRPPRGQRRPWSRPLWTAHPGLAGDLEVPAPLAGLSAAGTASWSVEAVAVAGTALWAVGSDGPRFAAFGAIDSRAGACQHRHQRRRNRGEDAQPGVLVWWLPIALALASS